MTKRSIEMSVLKSMPAALLAVFITLLAGPVLADFEQSFGKFVVYYNAFNSTVLKQDVAKQYGIVRSGNRGVITLSVHEKKSGDETAAVKADIDGSVKNLSEQLKGLTFKEIVEGINVYYVASFRFTDVEHMTFDVDIQPVGGNVEHHLNFRKKFFPES